MTSHLPDLLDQVDELKRKYRAFDRGNGSLDALIAIIEKLQAQLRVIKHDVTKV